MPYREQPVPPCAQHALVVVDDEDGGCEVWCADCEKRWWGGRRSTLELYLLLHRVIGDVRIEARVVHA